MPRSGEIKVEGKIQRKAANLAWERTRIAKASLKRRLGPDYEVLSKGYPDLTAFNMKTGTFYFVELKRESEIGKGLTPEQEKIKKILDKITGKNNYEVWYFGDAKETKRKIVSECFYIGKKIVPMFPKKLPKTIREKFGDT